MIGISLLMLAMVEGGATLETLFSNQNLVIIFAAVIMLAIFALVERKAQDPIIPFELFRNRMVSVSVAAGFLAGVAMFGAISFVPLFAQGALGSTATAAGSMMMPLMLSWVLMSIVGGRLLLKIGYRPVCIAGFIILTTGFVLLAMFQRETARVWLYIDLALIGAGLGLTMLTLLIAVQQAVERTKLGVATSLNQFSRAIGGAFGVALMGAVLTAGLATELNKAAQNGGNLTVEQAAEFASNPNALIDPASKATLPGGILEILQQAMANSIHRVFWVGAGFSALALLVIFLLPKQSEETQMHKTDENAGETMLMAEQTTINARNQTEA